MKPDRSPERYAHKDYGMAHRRALAGRALAVGIGASAVLHLVVILLYGVVVTQWGPGETPVAVQSASGFTSNMRVVRVLEIALPALTPEPPEELLEPTAEAPSVSNVGPPVSGDFDLDELRRGRSAAEVLRVTSSDTRLWREAMPELFELTEAERMELELAGRLEEWADSVAEVVAAEYALTDWTTTDDQGRRWGVSPGQLHLGDITLPLPFYFSGNSLQREAAARRAWEDQDILNGAATQALRSSWRERAEAIRTRRQRVRDETAAAPAAPAAPEVTEASPATEASDTTGTPGR
jgi:hypothetical protein